MKTAIVHDWLVVFGGAERVLEQMLKRYPDADLYSLFDFLPPDGRHFINNKSVTTSCLQRLPFARTRYRSYLPFFPYAIEQFDLSGYDLVISSSYCVAKGVITGPDQLHVCMCYSPMRYAWDLKHQYLKEANLEKGISGLAAKYLLHRLKKWDALTANGVDEFIAISEFIARRIFKAYRRDSTVIYPPVDVSTYALHPKKDDFYLTASRLVPYKKIDLIVETFTQMPDRQLIVIGDGPEYRKIKHKAGSNVQLLGYQPPDVLRYHMQRARAFVFAAEEDFGIVPLEAQACGTPVIAYGKGGALESILPDKTGVFFEIQDVASLRAAVQRFDRLQPSFDPASVRANALRFSTERFQREFGQFMDAAIRRFQQDWQRRPEPLSQSVGKRFP